MGRSLRFPQQCTVFIIACTVMENVFLQEQILILAITKSWNWQNRRQDNTYHPVYNRNAIISKRLSVYRQYSLQNFL